MEISFKLVYLNNFRIISRMFYVFTILIKPLKPYRKVKDSRLENIVLNNVSIMIESKGDYIFSEEDKKHLLNILKKRNYIKDESDNSSYMKHIHEMAENVATGNYDDSAEITRFFLALDAFTDKTDHSIVLDYAIFKHTKNKLNNSKIARNEYTLYIKDGRTKNDVKNFLTYTSNWLDDLLYRYACYFILSQQANLDFPVDPYGLEELYTQKHRLNGKESVLLIDYGKRLFYQKYNSIILLLDNYNEYVSQNSSSNGFKINSSTYNLKDSELRVILSIICHKKSILSEMDMYLRMTEIFRCICSDLEEFKIDSTNLLETIYTNHDAFMEKCKKKKEQLQKEIKDAMKVCNEITNELKTEKDPGTIYNLRRRKNASNYGLETAKAEFMVQEHCYRYLHAYKDEKALIDILNEHQRNYIVGSLVKMFKLHSHKSPIVRKKKLLIVLLILIILMGTLVLYRKIRSH